MAPSRHMARSMKMVLSLHMARSPAMARSFVMTRSRCVVLSARMARSPIVALSDFVARSHLLGLSDSLATSSASSAQVYSRFGLPLLVFQPAKLSVTGCAKQPSDLPRTMVVIHSKSPI